MKTKLRYLKTLTMLSIILVPIATSIALRGKELSEFLPVDQMTDIALGFVDSRNRPNEQSINVNNYPKSSEKYLTNSIKSSKNSGLHNLDLPSKIPSPAFSSSFKKHTFSSNFTLNNFDQKDTRTTEFKWYPWNFFGYKHSLDSSIKVNSDSSITLLGDKNSYNANIATASPSSTSSRFVGKAFGGGGYFEASFKFKSNSKINKKGWPAFWSMALEHLVPLDSVQWPGMSKGYEHFIEVDFFEFIQWFGFHYSGVMHDWYGTNKTCSNFYCHETFHSSSRVRRVLLNTDFTEYHRYGFLWVPATDSTSGHAEFYFDGQKVGPRTSWSKYTNQAPTPKSKPWTYGIIDKQHLVIILGTGFNQPMTVRSVDVWQASESQNMTHTSLAK